MKHKKPLAILILVLFIALLALNVRVSSAAPHNGYEISWYTFDGGGAMNASGGTFTLSGTIGQADAGAMSGGTYNLNSGFWNGVGNLFNYFLPLILK